MSDKEILDILLEFKDFLSQGWLIMDVFRSLGWIIILGLGWLVDSLESVTDSILGLKTFFADSDVSSLLKMLRPLSVILMAFSLLYTGYLIIFQKKVDREGIIVNVFLALVVIALLGTGMEKADRFTEDAVTALKGDEKDSLANSVIKQGILDIGLYDLQGWETPQIDPKNNIPKGNIRDIDINSYLTDGTKLTKEKELSNNGVDILTQKLDTLGDGSHGLIELDDGNFITDITKEYYYRYTVDWFTVMVTLAITAFTLLTISIKLAKLFFELTFNYVLATIIAPADIHSGQKTKQVIQNILNIFLVTIMIFLSMKIYLMGTAFIDEKLTGLPYLIALFAFSLAVIDGPNIVERLFGIDAGLKSGWGALAGAYAGGKGLSKGIQGLSSAGKSAALKGIGGAAGVAGMAQGLSSRNKDKDQEQKNEQSQNNSQGGKGEGISQKDINSQTANGENQNVDGSEEVKAGKEEAASSLEQDMKNQEQKNNEQSQSGTGQIPQGLHQEMASKGVGNNLRGGNISGQSQTNSPSGINTPSSANVSTPNGGSGKSLSEKMSNGSSNGSGSISQQMSGSSSGSGGSASLSQQMSGSSSESGGSVSEQMTGGSSGSVGSVSVSEQIPSGSRSYTDSSSYVPTNTSTNSVSSNNSSDIPRDAGRAQETKTVRETRHVGNVISDNVRNNKTVQKVQRSYQIGQNTGQSVRKNIAKFSRKNRGE
ncbi:pLS20_p028 family conjugation system transmembrane protein [Peribacillus butanolivorans]|uniref:pLS20_p028 family conjugation system transmembrane protein n=1 Tax=Peribacillus butanolivorans TaxID=421767 RepID=UPI00364672AF